MAKKKVKAKEAFGGASDFQGAFGTSKEKQESNPVRATEGTPHWHDSSFNGTEEMSGSVSEGDLSSHF